MIQKEIKYTLQLNSEQVYFLFYGETQNLKEDEINELQEYMNECISFLTEEGYNFGINSITGMGDDVVSVNFY